MFTRLGKRLGDVVRQSKTHEKFQHVSRTPFSVQYIDLFSVYPVWLGGGGCNAGRSGWFRDTVVKVTNCVHMPRMSGSRDVVPHWSEHLAVLSRTIFLTKSSKLLLFCLLVIQRHGPAKAEQRLFCTCTSKIGRRIEVCAMQLGISNTIAFRSAHIWNGTSQFF